MHGRQVGRSWSGKKYSSGGLAVVEEVAAGAELFAIPGGVAVGNADQVDIAHGFRPAEVEEVDAGSVVVIGFLFMKRFVIFSALIGGRVSVLKYKMQVPRRSPKCNQIHIK